MDESEYGEFTINGNTRNTVFEFEEAWMWVVTNVNGTVVPEMEVERTSGHKVYTVFAAPHSPWSMTFGDPRNPWSNVLDYACEWGLGATDEESAVSLITTDAYREFGKSYNGLITHTPGSHCNLTNMLADSEVDCRDMSAVVELFSHVLGGEDAQVIRVDGPFQYLPILPIGSSSWGSGGWNFHQFGWFGDSVYDANLKLKESSPYIPVGDDLNGDYKTNLYDFGDWAAQPAFSIDTFN